MTLFRRLFLVTALAVVAFGLRARAQEALEIRGDQDAPATEPTPIPERTAEPRPPAESDAAAEAEAKPKKKAPKEGEITDVQQMSPEQFKKAGLDKLSPAELQTLNQWLKGYKHAAETKAAEQATVEATEKTKTETKSNFNRSWLSTDRIFSRIDGEFTGIRRGNKKIIVRLEDGTVWKQANEMDQLEAKLTDHPPVMVTHSMVGYKMHVIGAGEFYVNPVRPR